MNGHISAGGEAAAVITARVRQPRADHRLRIARDVVQCKRKADTGVVRHSHTARDGDEVGGVGRLDARTAADLDARTGVNLRQRLVGKQVDDEGAIESEIVGFPARCAEGDVHRLAAGGHVEAVAIQRHAIFDFRDGMVAGVEHHDCDTHCTFAIFALSTPKALKLT